MDESRNAPVQMPHSGRVPHGIRFRIPWRIHKKAWEEYRKYFYQSAEELADRGGFELEELIYLLARENPFSHPEDDEMATDFFNRFQEEKDG